MGKPLNRYFAYIVVAMLSTGAQAADGSFQVADASLKTVPRFIPLRADLPRSNGLVTVPMRSDRAAMNNGFMRLDRAMLRPTQSFRAHPSKARPETKPEPVHVLRPSGPPTTVDETVADLFGDAPTEASFTDTLKQNGADSSSVRHSWPLPASAKQRLSSGYGMRSDPFTRKQRFHGGIDISAATGTSILASADGVVTKAERGRGLGNYVVVRHRDGSESTYGHLNRDSVQVGQILRQGQKLGELGSTGRSTGPHLDYRLKKNGQTVNPMTVLAAPVTRVASR